MGWNPSLNELRDVLAGLFPDEEDARRIATSAGLEPQYIRFDDKPINVWHNILEEATRRDKLQALLDQARHAYPNNPALQRAMAGLDPVTAGMSGPLADLRRGVPQPWMWALALALLVLVGLLLRWPPLSTAHPEVAVAEPHEAAPSPAPAPSSTPPPIPMSGLFNILVADFGTLDDQGQVQPSELGERVSLWLARRLEQELAQTGSGDGLALDVQIWQDGWNKPASNPEIGVVVDPQVDLERLQAFRPTLVIYGYVTGAADSPQLALDFFYSSPQLQDEPDAALGRHSLGRPIPIAYGRDPDLAVEKLDSNRAFTARLAALVWLTKGLIKTLVEEPADALRIFQDADHTLGDWQAADGRETLYYFMGRAALDLKQYDLAETAFISATLINDRYVNAHIGLGNVHFSRAQSYFTPAATLPAEVAACVAPTGQATPRTPTGHLPTTEPEAMEQIDQAIQAYLHAERLATAPDTPWPPILYVAQAMLGNAYRLKGEALTAQGDFPAARVELRKAQDAYLQTLTPFQQAQRHGFLAHVYLGLGAIARAQGYMAQRQGELDAARGAFVQALGHYAGCIQQEAVPDGEGSLKLQRTTACLCRLYASAVQQTLDELGGGEG